MKVFLYIASTSASLAILYPPWGTAFLSVAVINLCLHLMDLKTGPQVQLRKKPPRVEQRSTSPPRDKSSPKDTMTPEAEDSVKGLMTMGLKRTDAVRLVIRAQSEGHRSTKDLLRRCITLVGQK
jgi:hypothetical protein